MFGVELPESLKKYEGIIRFMIVLFAANFFWKFSFKGDEIGDFVTFWGMDCRAVFDVMIYHIADVSYSLLHFFGYPVEISGTHLYHSNMHGVVVIWGCSGLKQSFIFLMIMLFSRGAILHKTWYSLLGLGVVYFVNIFRIVLLCMLVENYNEYFDFMHGFVFKYLFYFIIFMMWVLWEEVLCSAVGNPNASPS